MFGSESAPATAQVLSLAISGEAYDSVHKQESLWAAPLLAILGITVVLAVIIVSFSVVGYAERKKEVNDVVRCVGFAVIKLIGVFLFNVLVFLIGVSIFITEPRKRHRRTARKSSVR